MKLHIVSLGCVRNLVDSEVMMGELEKTGWELTDDAGEAHTIVINTCGFIRSAVDESIDTILEMAKMKEEGACKRLIVAGCLPQRYGAEIAQPLPEVDRFIGTAAYDRIIEVVTEDPASPLAAPDIMELMPDPNTGKLQTRETPRKQSRPHLSYIKVAEGCNKHCTYCIIPRLRGKQRSRELSDITAEARDLVQKNTRELLLVAQDTTHYGRDIKGAPGLAELAEEISDLSEEIWIRVLYGNPDSIEPGFIEAAARRENICGYFDLPIQHASDRILKRMGRRYTKADLTELFKRIRKTVPGASIRTTVIVGFPGETEADFNELLEFVKELRFDHLGVFTYSDAEDLPSHGLPDHVDEETAQARYERLMELQATLSEENNRKHMGRTYRVLIEEMPEAGMYIGRTAFQAPEVDGVTFVYGKDLPLGDFVDVTITDTYEYDLAGDTA